MGNIFSLLEYLGIFFGVFCLFIYFLADFDIFFTKMETGNIKYIIKGDSLKRIIHDVSGKKLVNNKLEDGIEPKNWFEYNLGLYFIGIPPFFSIHEFEIQRESENVEGKTPEEWIRKGDKVLVSSLRAIIPRPFVLTEVELGDRTTIDLLLAAKFDVIYPEKPVFTYKGDFFPIAGSILRGYIADKIKSFQNLKDFIDAPKSGNSSFLKEITEPTGEFNKKLEELVGLRLISLSIPTYNTSDQEVLKAANAEAIAKLQANAKIAEATGTATAKDIILQIDKKIAKEINEAEVQGIIDSLKTLNITPDNLAQAVTEILQAKAVGGINSKITTWVQKGGNATTMINPKN